MTPRRWIHSHTNFLIVLSVGLIVLSLYLIFYATPLEVRNYAINFNVSDSQPIGIDVGTDSLSFGRVHPGTSVHREIDIQNSYDFPVTAKVYLSKSVARHVSVEPNPTTILPHSFATIGFTLTAPMNTSIASYQGLVRIEIFK